MDIVARIILDTNICVRKLLAKETNILSFVFVYGVCIHMYTDLSDLFVCLRLYVPVNIFSVILGRLHGFNQYLAMGMKCLVQGHNTAPRSFIRCCFAKSLC